MNNFIEILFYRFGFSIVKSRLVFDSASIPSESLVQNVTRILLTSRISDVSDNVKVLNVTYESKFSLLVKLEKTTTSF